MKTDASGFPENVRWPGIHNSVTILSVNPARAPQGLQQECEAESGDSRESGGGKAMGGWRECMLGDIAVLHYGKALRTDCRKFGVVPVYSSAGLTGTHDESLVNSKGLIVGRKGTVGKVYISLQPFWCIDTAYYILPDDSRYDFKYLYFLLQTIGLEELNEDSAVPGLNRDTAYQQRLLLPPLSEQKSIASILSSLDEKIDLLNRQNQTLEIMVSTLFRQWFVEDAQEGWDEKPLSSIAIFLNGLACQKYPPANALEKLPVLKIRELSSGISETSDWASSQVKPDYIVEEGDVIFAWSASLMVKMWNGEKCVLNQHLFKVTSDEFPKWFYLMWCKHHLAEFIAVAASQATTMGHIKRGDLDTAMVLVPPPDVLEDMTKQMQPLLDKQIANAKQRKTLEKLRDTLLPKLMSGEVRVTY